MSRRHKYQRTDNHDRINNLLPWTDAVFKTFMFTPETARDFLEIHLPYEYFAAFATCKPYAWYPMQFHLRKVYALTTRMFCGPWKPATVTAISTA